MRKTNNNENTQNNHNTNNTKNVKNSKKGCGTSRSNSKDCR